MRQKTIKATIIDEILTRFPDIRNLTAAKKAYKENPIVFKNIEEAREIVRHQRGNKNNRIPVDKKHIRENDFKYNPFDLPESHADKFDPYEVRQSKNIILSDLHFPYQDNRSTETALEYGLKNNANCIILNGDVLDFAGISRFEKDWRQRTVFEEFEAVRKFLSALRKHFPKAKIVFKEGNHDERWERWLYVKAPELFDDPEFKLEVRLRLGELKIDIVKDKTPIKLGKLGILHGHELGISGGIMPARTAFLKTLENILIGHLHRPSEYLESTMWGDVISAKSSGCLCGLHPQFSRINKWAHGFAFCELDVNTGEFELENLKIIKGKIYK